jgi:hypothetical protein
MNFWPERADLPSTPRELAFMWEIAPDSGDGPEFGREAAATTTSCFLEARLAGHNVAGKPPPTACGKRQAG